MKQRTLLATLLLALLPAGTWAKTVSAEISGTRGFRSDRQWHRTASHNTDALTRLKSAANSPITNTDETLGTTDNYGMLRGTDGSIWTYTMTLEKEKDSEGKDTHYYASATVQIYNSENKKVGEIKDVFDTSNEKVNSVQVNPLITKSFFNVSGSNYEIMLFVHGVTGAPDYKTRSYNNVYSIGSTEKVCTIEGNQVLAENMAADQWGEAYTMVFQRESETEEQYFLHFDVYTKATYANPAPVLVHTFDMDYSYIAGSGNESLPILMTRNGNSLYFATAHYEKPYFVPNSDWSVEPEVNPDNNLVITLYDNNFAEMSVTKIAVPTGGEYLYSFPTIGGLRYADDLCFGLFSEGNEPAYIITYDNYTSIDDYTSSFYVYNVAGERIATIAEDAAGVLAMSDVEGQEEQYCFLKDENEEAWFYFVDIPSCKVAAKVPTYLDNRPLSMSLDRYVAGDSYQIAVSISQSSYDSQKNIIHSIAWLNADGTLNHYDNLNLGQDINLAQVYMNANGFNPWLFNTDDAREYMVLVKRQKQIGSSATDEVLYIVNTNGERLLEYGPDTEKGGNLLTIMLYNADTKPALVCVYYNSENWKYTMHFTWLPLSKFAAGGDGSAQNPYLISTAGDFQQIGNAPSAYYRIVNDLDFKNIPWGGIKGSFSGSLDGGNYTLNHLSLQQSGLFTDLSGTGSIKNMVLYEPQLNLEGNPRSTGFIADRTTGSMSSGKGVPCVLSNLHIYKPRITGGSSFDDELGGIVGNASLYTQITQCSVQDADFDLPEASVGGIAGIIRTSTSISACSFSGRIRGNMAGGITAGNYTSGESITHCHAHADITGNTVGGIIGSSERATISNCYAEGTLTLNEGTGTGKAGGIAGELSVAYQSPGSTSQGATETVPVISNCLAGISAINIPEGIENVYAHRVVGYSSSDVQQIDWDKTTDYDNPVYLDKVPEAGISENYVISSLAPIDATIEAAHNTTEGATMAATDLSTDFLSTHNFAAGTTSDAPWVHDASPYLWYEKETGALFADKTAVSLLTGGSESITFTIINGDAKDIEIAISDPFVEILGTETAEDKVTIIITATGTGTATVTATHGTKTATCTVKCISETAVENITEGSLRIVYNGTSVSADNAGISLYDLRGTLLLSGKGTLYTTSLPDGIYIVRAQDKNETATLKILVK